MQRRHIDGRLGGLPPGGEDLDGASEQLFAPLADLVSVELEAFRELGERGIAFQRGERHLSLEGWGVIPTGTAGHEGSREVSERSLREPACLQSVLSEEPGPLLFLFAGLGLAARAIQPGESEHFLRDALAEQLQVLVLMEFLVSSYTLSLTAELVLVPILFSVTAVHAMASTRPERRSVERLASGILSLAGLAFIVNAVVVLIQTFSPTIAAQTIQAIVAPPLLTALLLPAVVLLALYSACENLGLQLQSWRPERRGLGRYTTRRILWHCRFSPQAVRKFSREYRLELMRVRSREDADALLHTVKAGVRGEAQQ